MEGPLSGHRVCGRRHPENPARSRPVEGLQNQGVCWDAFTEKERAANATNMATLAQWVGEGRLSSHVHTV
jgi:hypothetical protein